MLPAIISTRYVLYYKINRKYKRYYLKYIIGKIENGTIHFLYSNTEHKLLSLYRDKNL